MTVTLSRTTTMNMLHVAIGLAVAAGLPACKIAFSGPDSGQTEFVTDKAALRSSADASRLRFQSGGGDVTMPNQPCPDPWPHRTNGRLMAFPDHSFRYERC
jgi:hypothetical protein